MVFESRFERDAREIPDSFEAEVADVHDGDTITVVARFRKEPIKIRMADINAPEVSTKRYVRFKKKGFVSVDKDVRKVTIPKKAKKPKKSKAKPEPGALASRDWLRRKVLGEKVLIVADPKGKFGKYGRMIAYVIRLGENINESSLLLGYSVKYGQPPLLPTMDKILRKY